MMQHGKRISVLGMILLIGHLAIIAGLAFSALSPRPTLSTTSPAMTILNRGN